MWKYSSQKEDLHLEPRPIMHKTFEMKGDFNLENLEKLTKTEWTRLNPSLEENEIYSEETLVYGNPEAIVIISANYETNYHQIDINLKKYSEDNIKNIENIRLLLENRLEKKINEKKETSDLIDKLDLESN
jgi:hypothetical protein